MKTKRASPNPGAHQGDGLCGAPYLVAPFALFVESWTWPSICCFNSWCNLCLSAFYFPLSLGPGDPHQSSAPQRPRQRNYGFKKTPPLLGAFDCDYGMRLHFLQRMGSGWHQSCLMFGSIWLMASSKIISSSEQTGQSQPYLGISTHTTLSSNIIF